MAVTYIAFPSVFYFLAIVFSANGTLLYTCSWNFANMHWAADFYGRSSYTGGGRLNAHLQRNSAVLMLGSALLNIKAATSRSNSTWKVVASYWNYIIITHYIIEYFTDQVGGVMIICIAMMLILILYYEHREEALFAASERRRY
mmetsp:Transcript_11251/g.15593  ORF Transcript_11251/g.15593 Transcript_11251/m.15593 type:complete len:144 (+) Transcript_11251:220-651(+)|eukprot:CAMPEP_0185254508 /NCGR_PEP_ID=MMETSP1359-20130426/3334_1 /TAXON_ID=552665 /ORGANISM="Bigelowiella longifila, Strain CCMP242" /LENGTH=143 /DNA_ID=CAMNT_0027837595 /DNA_START=139 /DNA_END=570 /DNA_ORIENTATION=+